MGNNRKRSPSNKEKEKGKGKGKGKGSLQTNERDVRIQIDDLTSQGQSPALRSNESTSTQSSETRGSTFFENISGSAFTGGTYQQTNGHSNSVTIELNVNHYPPTQDSNASQSPTSQPSPPFQPSSSQKASTDLSSSPVEAPQYTSSSNDLPHQKNNYDVYTEQLQRQRRGNPLYNPEPNRRLPMIYQRMGVSIGDVGTFTQFGGFSFLFNICLPRDHPSQPDDLLEDFEPINLRARDVYSSTDFKPGSHLASQNIHKVSNDCRSADLIFETDVSEGAILTLPEGFVAHDLENLPQIQAYAAANIESWYRYINGTCGRLAKNGEIRLVIGCDKTTSWGMAVINNQERPTHHQLRFRPVGSMTPSSTSSSSPIPLHTWDYSGYVNAKVGPYPEEIEVLREEDNSTAATTGRYSNQCLFVRTLNLTLRDGVFASINDELALVLKEKWSSFSSTSHNSTNSSSSSINEPCSGRANQAAHGTNFGTQRGFSANIGDEHVTITMSPTAEKSHPSDALNRTILEKAPGCRVAITRDEHWCSVLNEDDECMPSTVQLAERVFKSYDIVEENGVAFLEHKKQNALSTSASYTVLSSYVHRFDGVTRPTLQIAAPQNAPDLSLYRARTKKEVHLHDENGTAISKIEDDEYKLALEHDVLSTSKEHDLPHKGYMALENITTKFYGPSRAIEQLHEEYPQEQQSFPWNSMFTENQMMVQQPPIISPFSDYEDYPHIYSSPPPPLEPDMDTMKPQGHSDPPAIVMDVNDLISSCLSLVPVPGLIFAFTTLRWVITTAEQIQDSKEQIRNLTESLAQLMLTLNDQYKKGKLLEQDTRNALVGLATLLGDVSKFIEGQKKNSIFAQIITNKKRLDTIDSFHRRIAMSVNAFHVASLIDAQHLMKLNEYARQNDQRQMYKMLRDLQSNQRALMEALDISKNEPIAMMAALERRIEERPEASDQQGDLYNFYTTSLFHLRTTSGKKADLAPWSITSFDVEFGRQIGSGGFGTVFRAKWNEMDVAVKVMRNSAETIPRAATVRREVDTWSRLRHPHILQFLGANILDDKPFIVTPLIRGGNVAEYVVQNPDCNRLIIIHQISLGLAYLHGQRVVHGDIKCTNVLIDDGGNALLCDFGLARIKADVNSRSLYTSLDVGTQLGSRNWMAPELFEGSSLKMPCDVYALGMTIYEIYTGEVPLSQIHSLRLQEAVLHGTRPQRPDDYEAPQLTDAIWMIAERCWARSPAERPTADTLCRDIKLLLESPPLSPPPPEFPSPPPPTEQMPVDPVYVPFPPTCTPPRANPARQVPPTARPPPESQRSLPPAAAHLNSPLKRSGTIVSSVIPATTTSGRIRIVDPSLPTKRPWKKYLILKKNDSNITCIQLSPNQKVVLTGHVDGTLRVWDAWKGVVKRDYSLGVNSVVTTIAFSPTTAVRYVAASKHPSQSTTSVYVVLKDKSLTLLNATDVITIANLTVLSDETIVGVERVGNEAFVIMWKRLSGRTPTWTSGIRIGLLGLDALPEPLAGCGFVISPDGKTIWTGNTSRSIFTSMVETGQQNERSLRLDSDQATSGPIYNHPNQASNGSSDSDGSTLVSFPPQSTTEQLVRLACAPDGKKLAISYSSGEILVLDLRSKKVKMIRSPKATWNPEQSPLERAPPVIFSADGSRVIYPCDEQKKTIKIQDIATNSILDSVLLSDCPANEEISCITTTPNFKHITLSFTHGTQALVYIWD